MTLCLRLLTANLLDVYGLTSIAVIHVLLTGCFGSSIKSNFQPSHGIGFSIPSHGKGGGDRITPTDF